MDTKIYAIYDTQAKAHLQPFFAATDGIAIRSVQAALDDKNSNFAKYPQDFTLYNLGSFDDQTGIISAKDPELVISFNQLADTAIANRTVNVDEVDIDDIISAGGTQ